LGTSIEVFLNAAIAEAIAPDVPESSLYIQTPFPAIASITANDLVISPH